MLSKYTGLKDKLEVLSASFKYKKYIKRLKGKDEIAIVFQLIHASIWKFDRLYWVLEESKWFKPSILICPHYPSSEEEQKKEYERARKICQERGYRYFDSLQHGECMPLKTIDMPKADIVFIQNSWERTYPQYQAKAWVGALICYVPYFLTMNVLERSNYNKLFHKKLWRYFVESEYHKNAALKYKNTVDMDNLVVTGYPGLDRFLSPRDISDPWSDVVYTKKKKTRIIYAPHHTISNSNAGLAYSTFEKFAWDLLEIAESKKKSCHFSFKPHPLLYDKLLEHPEWGRGKADDYWKKWHCLENGQVDEGDYEGLFLHSDALIHDCNSFLAEYLGTGKPALFLMINKNVTKNINDFGNAMLKAHYVAEGKDQIESFIKSVVVEKKDSMLQERHKAIDAYLLQSHERSSSENIYKHLRDSLV